MSVPYPPNPYQTNPYQPQPKVRFDWISEAWQLFTANAGTWIGAILIVLVICYGSIFGGLFGFGVFQAMSVARMSGTTSTAEFFMPGYWVTVVAFSLISAFFVAGMLKMSNAQVRRQPVELGMLFSGGTLVLPLFLFQIVFGIASYVGALLLVLPLFIVTGLLAPAYALIADGVPVGQAISRSVNAVKSDWLMAGVFAFVYILLLAVSAIPCGLGLLATYPMAAIILSLVYRDMIGMPMADASAVPNAYATPQSGVWPPSPTSQPYAAPPATAYPPGSAEPPSTWPPTQPLAGAPQPPPQPPSTPFNPDEPEIGRADGPGTLPPPPSAPEA